MAQVNNFDGGLSLRIDPSLIKVNEAQHLVNVDPNPVVLCSAKTFTTVVPSVDVASSFYRFKNSWVSDNNTDYVEYEDSLYSTQVGSKPQKFDAVKSYDLGISAPIPVLAVDSSDIPILDVQGEQFKGLVIKPVDFLPGFITSISAKDNGDLIVGEYNYKITTVNNHNNTSEVNKSFTLGSGSAIEIKIEELSSVKVRVYREYNGTYYKIADTTLDERKVITDLKLDISNNVQYTAIRTTKSTLQYTVTYYNEADGTESAPMKYSNELEVSHGTVINVTNIPKSDDAQVTHRKIYRLGGNLIGMTLVAKLDNTIDSFYDYTSDINATEVLTSQNHYQPDSNMHSLTEAYSIFFGIVGNEVRFSEIGEPDVWPPENSIKLGKAGTGMLPVTQGVLLFTQNETYLLTGTNKAQFSRILITKRQGCLANKSCQVVKNTPLWVSHEGICTLQNGHVQVLSKPLLGRTSIDVLQSTVYDEQYFLLKTDGTLLVLDVRSGFRFYQLKFTDSIGGVGTFEGKLYFAVGGKLSEAFTGDNMTLEYTSPLFIEGNHSNHKMYNNVYIRANGVFTVKMFIDGELALTQDISGNTTFDLTPPTDKQRGYGCHFNIVGVGTVYTINNKILGKQNGG